MLDTFTPEQCSLLEQAFVTAWQKFVHGGRLTAENVGTAQTALVAAVLHGYTRGENDFQRLAVLALTHFDAFDEKIRSGRLELHDFGGESEPAMLH
jgi:hypothetical protein